MKTIEDEAVKALLIEASTLKLLLHVIAKAMLAQDEKQANEEVNSLIKDVERLAFRASVGGLERESSETVLNVSKNEAIRFLNTLRPRKKN